MAHGTNIADIPGVSEWFSNKNVLITGGTGFIGKSILEKLLRSCPDVGTIYLLLRTKKGQSVESRLESLKKSEIFSFTPGKYDWSKVKTVEADPLISGCDLQEDVAKELKENVNVIFHVAATIRFDERLFNAVNANVRLTYDMIELAKNMQNLMVFLHVSTAFANSDRTLSDEEVYPQLLDWKKTLSQLNDLDDKAVDGLTPKILGLHPNTYTFTKQMAEALVWDHRNQIPVVIFRPVIVTNTMYEPAVGWSDNFSGAEVIYYLIGKGVLRALYIKPERKMPYCPVDVTANTAIVAAWNVACHSKIRQEKHDEVVCSTYWLQSTDEAIVMGKEAIKEHPIPNILWTDYFIPCTNDLSFLFCHILFNFIPAMFFQFLIGVTTGKKVMLIKAQRKIFVTMNLTKTIILRKYTYTTGNHDKLLNALSDKDKKMFNIRIFESGNIEPTHEEFMDYLKKCMANVIRFMGDPKISKEAGLRQQKIMKSIDTACRIALVVLVVWFIPYRKLSTIFAYSH